MITATLPFASEPQAPGGSDGSLLKRLTNPAPATRTNPVFSAPTAWITLGLLPLFVWPLRWAGMAEDERKDLLEVARWWRRRVGPAEAAQLDAVTDTFRPAPLGVILPWLAAIFVAGTMLVLNNNGVSIAQIWDLAYHNSARHEVIFNYAGTAPNTLVQFLQPPLHRHLHSIWMWGLVVGYACHLAAVRSHMKSVSRLVAWTNHQASTAGLPPVRERQQNVGGLLWLGLIGVSVYTGVWWGIPMALVGSAQGFYARKTGPTIRRDFGRQIQYAGHTVVSDAGLSAFRFCSASHCGARVPTSANFCPRCGSAVRSSGQPVRV